MIDWCGAGRGDDGPDGDVTASLEQELLELHEAQRLAVFGPDQPAGLGGRAVTEVEVEDDPGSQRARVELLALVSRTGLLGQL